MSHSGGTLTCQSCSIHHWPAGKKKRARSDLKICNLVFWVSSSPIYCSHESCSMKRSAVNFPPKKKEAEFLQVQVPRMRKKRIHPKPHVYNFHPKKSHPNATFFRKFPPVVFFRPINFIPFLYAFLKIFFTW